MRIQHVLMAFAIFFTTTALQAQNGEERAYETKGFYLNTSLLGASWTMDELNIDDDNGAGVGLKLGYNVSNHIGIFSSLNAALMSPEEDEYVLAHLDLGLQGTFMPVTSRFRPFLNVAVSGMTAQDDETEINGAGLSISGGALFFLSRNLAFDISYTHGLIDLTEVKSGSQTVDIDETATTMRLFLGLGWYF